MSSTEISVERRKGKERQSYPAIIKKIETIYNEKKLIIFISKILNDVN